MNDAFLPTIITTPSSSPMTVGMDEPPLGADNYQIGGEIARGGMGSILSAEDSKLKRTVAVKIMHLDASVDDSARQRFLREAEVLAMLAHPNIVPIYDIVWEDGLPLFYSMKMVKGRNLQAIINDLRQEHPEALRDYTLDRLLLIFRKVCDAIAFAHSKGVLHRDLKPENVMVGEFGEVLVMDWGLARRLGDHQIMSQGEETLQPAALSLQTLQGSVMGTPQYMSPEQAMGQIDELDERSDIFSLGAILYAILTLRPPVEGKTLEEVLSKVASAEITPPSVLGSTTGKRLAAAKGDVLDANLVNTLPHTRGGRIPTALSAVVMKSLRLDKVRRYQSVAEFSADIEAYQTGFATKAEQAGLGKQIALLIKRHRGMFTTAAAACLFITTLAVWFVINLRAEERRALAGEQKAIASEAVAVREKEATRQALAKSAFALAESALREGNGVEMQDALSDVPEDLRDNTWHYLKEQSDTSFASVRTNATHITSVAAHPRLPSVFAVADSDGKVSLIEVRTGVRQLEIDPGFTLKTKNARYCLAFSPDGEQLAVGRINAGGIVIHQARDGTKLREWSTPGAHELEFSPDGQLLLLNESSGRRLSVWDVHSGEFAWAYEASKLVNARGVFTPDSQQMLTFSFGDDFRVVDARKGTLIRTLSLPRNRVSGLTMEPDGTAVSVNNSGYVTRFEIQEGRVLSEFRAHDMGFKFIVPSSSGEQLVTATTLADGRQALQVWRSSTGERTQALLGGSGEIASISLHPLSGELFVSGTEARVWSVSGAPAKWLIPSSAIFESIAFWGESLFASNSLFRLDAESPTPLWRAGPQARTIWPNVSADGRFAIVGSPAEARFTLLRNSGAEIVEVSSFTHQRKTRDVRLSPSGDRVAAIEYSYHHFALYETAKGRRLARPDHTNIQKVWDVVWLNEGKRIVGLVTAKAERGSPGSEEWVVLWDAATGQILKTAVNATQMDNLAVSPDGRRFAEAGVDKRVRLRDAETLAVQQEFRAHDDAITALAWHPTRPILATGSADLCIRLWDLEAGLRLEELRGPLAPPSSLAFSSNGQRIGCTALLEETRVWEPQSLHEAKRLEK
jgi:serine/threonine protein kinase/WD40 repeat protein